jgi:hypothetical protein
VAKGFTQKKEEDYFDTYSPVARLPTIRVLLALAAAYKLLVHQMDVKTTFLNGELEEEIYMQQLEGFVVKGQESKVCRLIKSLYGLKQAPRQWHEKCWGPSASEGPQKRDLTMFSKYASRYLRNQVVGIQKHGQVEA